MRATVKTGLLLTILVPSFCLAELGFWPVDSHKVPAAMRNSTKAVFRLTVYRGDVIQITPDKIREYRKLLESPWGKQNFSNSQHLLFEHQFAYCEAKKILNCEVLGEFRTGTAFITESGEIATAFHNIEAYLEALFKQSKYSQMSYTEKLASLKDIVIPVAIENSVLPAQIVGLQISRIHNEAIQWLLEGGTYGPTEDAIFLTTKSKIPLLQGIKIAKLKPSRGDKIFVLGYPQPTVGRREKASVPDADGRHPKVMLGKTLNYEEAKTFHRRDVSLIPKDLREFFQQTLVITDSDGNYGASGGPMLNEAGEAVAIVNVGAPEDNAILENRVTVGSSLIDYVNSGLKKLSP